MATAGYSGTPLARKLGLKSGQRVCAIRPPNHLGQLLRERPEDLEIRRWTPRGPRFDQILLFARNAHELDGQLPGAADRVNVDGSVWVCWPKKSSPLFKDLTEDGVRSAAFPLSLVDVKVCAVDADWSGLKLVYRRERRAAVQAAR